MLRQNRTLIDLSVIAGNYRALEAAMPPGTRVMPVVKADAYGHGIVEVAKTVVREGATCLGVALAEEGICLRENGLPVDVLVLGTATERAVEPAIQYGLMLTVFEPEMVAKVEESAKKLQKTARVHIKVDTGMERIGLRTVEEAEGLAKALAKAPHVQVAGIFTHFADGDCTDGEGEMGAFSRLQLERFLALRQCFGADVPAHAANSAMSLVAPNEAGFQMVREGIALYGYPPVKTNVPLRHALRWESEVVHVKEVPKGTTIGYGRTYVAPREMRVATVAVGYGDGYHRAASNRAQMLVQGKRAPVVGRICMDQTMIDVTDIGGVAPGSQVVLIGAQGADEIDADELAGWMGTISYEVLLAITRRVPRVYS